jgi:beta-N-acetylhexosaminidase
MGMTAHVRYTAWDGESPGTLSPFIIREIIRQRIGFEGLLLSDDIDMQALTGPVPERSLRAMEAGCDIVLNCWAKMGDMVGMAKLLPAISNESAARLERALAVCGKGTLQQGNREQLLATRDDLLERLRDVAA